MFQLLRSFCQDVLHLFQDVLHFFQDVLYFIHSSNSSKFSLKLIYITVDSKKFQSCSQDPTTLTPLSPLSQLLKTAEQLVKAGNVDRERVRDTTKRLDTLWQGLTSRLNTHKEALSYSVTFHQKLEQVSGTL